MRTLVTAVGALTLAYVAGRRQGSVEGQEVGIVRLLAALERREAAR